MTTTTKQPTPEQEQLIQPIQLIGKRVGFEFDPLFQPDFDDGESEAVWDLQTVPVLVGYSMEPVASIFLGDHDHKQERWWVSTYREDPGTYWEPPDFTVEEVADGLTRRQMYVQLMRTAAELKLNQELEALEYERWAASAAESEVS